MRETSGSHRGGDKEGKEVSRELRLDQYTSHSQMQRQQCNKRGGLEVEAEEDRKRSTLISAKQESVNERRRQPHVEMVGSHRAAEECLQRLVKHLLL